MANLKVEDLYWRIYADHQLKIFTFTMTPLKEPTHHELVAHKDTLKAIAKGLRTIGWQEHQRRVFELCVRKGTAVL
jgi:hypothetical protein